MFRRPRALPRLQLVPFASTVAPPPPSSCPSASHPTTGSGGSAMGSRAGSGSACGSAPPPRPWDIRDELGPTDATTMLSSPFKRFPDIPEQYCDHKPRGLWYSVGPAWLDFVRENIPEFEREYHHKLTLDRGRVLQLTTARKMEVFTRKYSVMGIGPDYTIDWPRVVRSSGFGGIEVSPHRRFRGGASWHSTWDTASGVVWDDSIILAVTPIPRQGEFVPPPASF